MYTLEMKTVLIFRPKIPGHGGTKLTTILAQFGMTREVMALQSTLREDSKFAAWVGADIVAFFHVLPHVTNRSIATAHSLATRGTLRKSAFEGMENEFRVVIIIIDVDHFPGPICLFHPARFAALWSLNSHS